MWNNRSHHFTHQRTLFGYGQHYGATNCTECGAELTRNSGRHSACGPYYDKSSCAYKKVLKYKKLQYRNKKYQIPKVKIIKREQSYIEQCSCGRRYLITRENQNKCLFCINQYEFTGQASCA